MRNLSMGTVAAGLVIALMSGCASSPVVMRGQSPDAYAGAQQRAPIQRVGYNQYYNDMGMDAGLYGGENCDPNGFGHEFCAPPQSYRFQYQVPQGLNYPPQNAMPGVVQYPYYTVKGPDCFFHQ